MSMATASMGNTAASYGAVAKTFHWLTALVILTLIPLGLVANAWPYETSAALATKGWLFSLHKTLGLLAFLVGVLRIGWAMAQPKPGLLNAERKLEAWAAETVHWLLYASLVIVPLSGWLHHAATSGFAPIWWPFGQSLPFVPVDEGVAKLFAAWHWLFTKVLAAAVLLHVTGALKHHFIDRDQTLARMLPGRAAIAGGQADHPRAPAFIAAGIYAAAVLAASALGLGGTQSAAVPTPQLVAEPTGWTVEEGRLGISVTQMGSPVEGQFQTWQAAIAFDPDAPGPVKGEVRVQIAVPSVTLGSVTEEALKPEFFAAEEHPTAVFDAEIRADEADGAYVADGTLTLKGSEQPLALPFTLTLDGDLARMEGSTTIDRRRFDIGTANYNDESTVAFDVSVDVALTARRAE